MTKVWGECTWYLFHTLAEKIKDEIFTEHKENILNMIKNICSNLPCPDCRHDATLLMSKLDYKLIKNKQDLKSFLNYFHNCVNKKTNKANFSMEDCDKKYSIANTNNIVNYFIMIWSKKSHNPKLMTDDLHKTRLIHDFKNWWNINKIHFN